MLDNTGSEKYFLSYSNNLDLILFKVALKIIKHCQEEGAGELPQGILSGLLNNNIVEVTNCFPRPSNEDDDFNERKFF